MMTYVLVHGFWLDGSSWDQVAAPLRAAGHQVLAPSLPTAPTTTLRDHVDVVLASVDRAQEAGPVVLVGSSAAATHVLVACGERPEAVSHAVYVDTLPRPVRASDDPPGESIPFSWDLLEPDETRDLTEEQRSWLERTAVPFPAAVARAGWEVDPRGYDVPAVVVGCAFDASTIEEWRASWPGELAVVDRIPDLEWRWLPTGHWPQLTRPDDLAALLLDVGR